jgi:hypothetical protein
MLSTAKAEAVARDLGEQLKLRGFEVLEQALPKGKKLTLNSNQLSIRIEAKDAVSKDIFGNDLDAFTPHDVKVAINTAAASHKNAAIAVMALSKVGFDLKIGEGNSLANAEAAADNADVTRNAVKWPTRGA